MTKREDIIRDLENLGAWHTHHYAPFHYEAAETIHNTIVLLREQNPTRPGTMVRCKDCVHRPSTEGRTYYTGFDLRFPDNGCPCQCEPDGFYSWMPDDDWFCANGERKVNDNERGDDHG